MRDFADIIALAAERKGGRQAIDEALATTPALPPQAVAAIPDDRILASMTRRIFNAGFSAKVIEAKWPAFEAAFENFAPPACAFMNDERFDALMANKAIVRNGAKIRAVQVNAKLLLDLASSHGTAARFLADWPDNDYAGLLAVLKDRGSHLGGDSGMRFLRDIGKPAFITTKDVVTALIRENAIPRPPTSKHDFATIQTTFNQWSQQLGLNLTEISRILAMSVGP